MVKPGFESRSSDSRPEVCPVGPLLPKKAVECLREDGTGLRWYVVRIAELGKKIMDII